MISKETYTKIFLTQAEYSVDSANVKLHLYKWWQSHRSKAEGGLRLSDEGMEFLTEALELKGYTIPFTDPIDLHMDCPYFLTNSAITVFSERKSFELYMFSDDIRRYGLVKAMNKRLSDNQTSE